MALGSRSIDITVNLIRGAQFAAGMQIFRLITDGVASVANVTKDATVESVKLAASFERTQNSLRVYAGSLTAAGRELKAVSDLASNTPGLRLESAEKGYQRLRSIGFEAEKSRRLLAGLGKEKILSGADNEAVERVIFNFGQLRVGAQKFSQEAREILTQMPSLRRAFLDAFGTLNPQKIQALFDTNPDAFFDKLTESMEKSKGITSDTIDSYEKLLDQLILVGREGGKPLLPVITTELQNLTAFVKANAQTWADWGQTVANVARGARIKLDELQELNNKPDPVADAVGGFLGDAWLFLNPGVKSINKIFADLEETGRDKTSSLVRAEQERLKREAENIEEFRTEQANREFARIQEDERHRTEALRILDTYHKSRQSILENAFSVESALLDARPVLNLEQEKTAIQNQTGLRSNLLKSQIAVESAFYKEQERLNADNKLELEKIGYEKNQTLEKLQADLIVNQIKGAKELERIEREIIQTRREALQELNQLSAQSARQSLDTTSFNFERSLNIGGFDAAAFNRFRDDLAKSYGELTQLSSEFYRNQLLNESLTAEQRTNILRQLNLEQTGLAEELRRRMLEIGDRQYSAQIEQFENYQRSLVERYQARAQFFATIGATFFNPENFGADTSGSIRNLLLRQTELAGITQRISEAEEAQLNVRKQMDALRGAAVGKQGLSGGLIFPTHAQTNSYNKLIEASEKLKDKSGGFRSELEKLKGTIPDVFYEFERLAKQIEGGNVRAFDQAAKAALDARHRFEQASLQSEIDAIRGTVDKDTGVKKEGLLDVAESESKRLEYQLRLNQLLRQQESQRLTQATELTEQYKNSLDGLAVTLERLRAGSTAETAGFQYLAKQNILREQIGLFGEIIELQERLAVVGQDSAERYQAAWLSANLAIKEANIKAVESQIESQVRIADASIFHSEQVRARVLSHLAEQKSLSQSFADGIIGIYDKISEKISKTFGAVGEIPLIGDLLKFGANQGLNKIFTGLLDNILPPSFKELFDKEKNPIASPIVSKLEETNKILREIATGSGGQTTINIPGVGRVNLGGQHESQHLLQSLFSRGFGSGGGIGGTPNFNPNIQSGGNPLASLLGLFGFGGSRSGGGLSHEIRHAQGAGGGGFLSNISQLFSNQPGGLFAPLQGRNGQTSAVGGYISGIGQIAALAGSFIPGKLGSVISGVGTGASLGAQIGTFIAPGLGTLIGAGIGALGGFLATIFGSPKQKKDKKENLPALQASLGDALKALRDLAANKNAIRNNPEGAVTQAESLVTQISSGFSIQFLSKKYKQIAQNQIRAAETEAKSLLKTIRDFARQSEAANLRPILPEFQDGGMVSKFIQQNGLAKQFSGLVPGVYDRKDDKIIAVSGREVVLKPEDWMPIVPYLKERRVPGFQHGGAVSPVSLPSPAASGDTYINIYLQGELITAKVQDVVIEQMGSGRGKRATKVNLIDLTRNREVQGIRINGS